jgi:hypothetical protein
MSLMLVIGVGGPGRIDAQPATRREASTSTAARRTVRRLVIALAS